MEQKKTKHRREARWKGKFVMNRIEIRPAAEADAAAMLDIYGPYVEKTTVSSEYEAPSMEEFCRRIRAFTAQLPWLVCSIDGQVAGYGYASPHRTRAAYQWSVETSIYVAPEFHRRGVARALYSALFELLRMQGYYNIYVGITSPNERSIKFHKAMGFIISGAYQNSMYKFGQWRDVLWMGKELREHDGEPQPTVAFPELRDTAMCARVLKEAAAKIRRKKDESTIAGSAELC